MEVYMFDTFLDPKNDIAFKRIFGTEKNKNILVHFLNDVVSFKGKRPIVSVSFLPTVQDPETNRHKASVVDVLCMDEQENKYIVEMQVAEAKGFEKRAQYYAAKVYCSQSCAGGEYSDLKEVIFLAIVDYIMFPEKKSYKSDHIILDIETHEHNLKDFSYTFIELPKFTKTLHELTSWQDKWCYFLKHAVMTTPEEWEQLTTQNPLLQQAYHELDRCFWSRTDLMRYEAEEKQRQDYLSGFSQVRYEERVKAKAELVKEKAKAKAKLEKEKSKAEAKLEKAKAEAKLEKAKAEAKLEEEKVKAEAKLEEEKVKAEAKLEEEKAKAKERLEEEKAKAKERLEEEKAKTEAVEARFAKAEQDNILITRNLIRALKQQGLSTTTICHATQLSESEIDAID